MHYLNVIPTSCPWLRSTVRQAKLEDENEKTHLKLMSIILCEVYFVQHRRLSHTHTRAHSHITTSLPHHPIKNIRNYACVRVREREKGRREISENENLSNIKHKIQTWTRCRPEWNVLRTMSNMVVNNWTDVVVVVAEVVTYTFPHQKPVAWRSTALSLLSNRKNTREAKPKFADVGVSCRWGDRVK